MVGKKKSMVLMAGMAVIAGIIGGGAVMALFMLIGAIPATWVVWTVWDLLKGGVGTLDYNRVRMVCAMLFIVPGMLPSIFAGSIVGAGAFKILDTAANKTRMY